MNEKTAETYLPCYRADRPMLKTVTKAAKVAQADPALRERLRVQMEFDKTMVGVIHSIESSGDLRQKVEAFAAEADGERRSLRSQLTHPALLSGVFGVLLMLGFLLWEEFNEMREFPGQDQVERIVGVARVMSGAELDPTHTAAGELADSFYMRGFEGFVLPPELAKIPTVGIRVFKQNGHNVAQLAVDAHNALVYVFRASDFGVGLQPGSQWTVFTTDIASEQWAVGIRVRDGLCVAVSFRGSPDEMKSFLGTLRP